MTLSAVGWTHVALVKAMCISVHEMCYIFPGHGTGHDLLFATNAKFTNVLSSFQPALFGWPCVRALTSDKGSLRSALRIRVTTQASI
jgi:hypothetical protein